MSSDAKTLNKIMQTESNNILEGSYTMTNVSFIPGMQGWFNICKSSYVI
jgi:hypothetical protein